MQSMSIGALSARTDVKIPTIRYYESIGLLPEPPRTVSNRRAYGAEHVHRLRFIRHARELGFEVEDIRQLLALSSDPNRPCGEVDAIARKHLAGIESRIARLQGLRAEVQRMIEQCACGEIKDCRVVEVLADHGECASRRH
jgi:DNA-binding transcriptional MerR regulator